MKKYEKPQIEITKFDVRDVITLSDGGDGDFTTGGGGFDWNSLVNVTEQN